MRRHWTFGQRIGAGFGATVMLALAIGGIAVYALRTVVTSKDRLIDVNARLLADAQELLAWRQTEGSELRGFLLTRDERFFAGISMARVQFAEVAGRMRQNALADEDRQLLDVVVSAEDAFQRAADQVIALRRTE